MLAKISSVFMTTVCIVVVGVIVIDFDVVFITTVMIMLSLL